MAVWRGHIWPAKRPFYSTLIFCNACLSNQLCESDRDRELQTLTRVLLSLTTELDYTPVYVRVAGHGTVSPQLAWRFRRAPVPRSFHAFKVFAMAIPSAQILSLMKNVAELRAAGFSWDSIGPQMGRSARTCRRWPTLYPDDWDRLFELAERRIIEELGSEGRRTLKRMLRSKNEKLQQDTGKFLSRLRFDSKAAHERKADQTGGRESKYAPYIAFLETLDDDQARAFLDEYVVRRMAELRDAQPAADSPAGQGVGQ